MFGPGLSVGVSIAAMGLSIGFVHAAERVDLRPPTTATDLLRSLDARGSAPARTPDALPQALAPTLGLSDREDLQLVRRSRSPAGVEHLHYNQTYRNVPIWGERVIVSRTRTNALHRTTGTLVRGVPVDLPDTTPTINLAAAIERVRGVVRSKAGATSRAIFSNETSRLVIYVRPSDRKATLSYEVSFFSVLNPFGAATRPVFLIDAKTGETIRQYEALTTAEGTGPGGNLKIGRYRYAKGDKFGPFEVAQDGETCTLTTANVTTENLNHTTAGTGQPFSYKCFDNTAKEINGAYSPLNDAHHYGNVVFKMYSDWYSARPITQKLLLQVHYGTDHENAYWNGQTMMFGDGASRMYPLVSLDIVSHEVSHGFTEQNSGLIYEAQSGGINEAFSDMAGEAAKSFDSDGRPSNYMVGFAAFKQPDGALRYMCEPAKDGLSIESAKNYRDGMDVHHSSGVFNKAFCLLSKTAGWDVRKAFHVFLVANRDHWTPSTNFIQGAQGAVDAATDLGYPVQDVRKAFEAVDVVLPVTN